ncbi:MAG: hypothetical protein ACMUIA_07730 [bacterium]
MIRARFFKVQSIFLSFVISSVILFLSFPQPSHGLDQQVEEGRSLPWTVQVMFGIRGPKPLVWDGKASVSEGKIEGLQGINFSEKDRLFPDRSQWKCTIDRLHGSAIADQLGGLSPREYLEERKAKGIMLDLHAPRNSRVSMTTEGGVLSFSLADLSFGKSLERLEGNVRIQLSPRSFIFGSKKRIDNYPAVAVDSLENVWTAWVSYKRGRERLVLRKYDGRTWGKELEISDTGCYLQPSLAGDYEGGLWACWSGRVKDNWDIYARYFKDGSWSQSIRLTDHAAPDTNQCILVDEYNRLWVCWQSFQFEHADIFMKYYEQGQWSQTIRITDHPGNDWQPAVTSDPAGNVYVAWDTYRNRKHAILLRQISGRGNLGPEIEVASTDNYVAHASLAADEKGRVWIAWDMSADDWGFGEDEEDRYIKVDKFEAIETQINYNKIPMAGRRGRYNSRTLGLVCYYGGKLYKTSEDLYTRLPATMKVYADLPQLQIDASGRLWLFFHHYIGKIPFYIHDKLMEIWKVYGTYYDGRAWSSPIELAHTTWRNIFAPSTCITRQSNEVWITYAGDNRQNESRSLESASIYVAAVNLEKISPHHPELIACENQPRTISRVSYEEIIPLPQKRYESSLGKEKYQLFWGTLHEQHDVRGRMAMDGFVVDAFKYALDDQQYEFLGISDYAFRDTSWFGSENYPLWEAKKAKSIYTTQRDFFSFYVTGRSPYKRAPGHSLQKRPIPKGMPIITAVYAKDRTEESFLEALENKRNYVATDWIILDFAIEGHAMGEKFPGTNPHPKILAKIIGTDEIEQVDIIRNAKCIYSSKSVKGKEADVTFVDMDLPSDKKDDYHYFIQMKQKDGAMAWTPPCCYHYTPTALKN